MLVVDSDPASISSVRSGLVSKHYRVNTAINHEEAIESFLHDSSDVIVVDMELIGSGCHKLIKFVRNFEDTRVVPFVFITSEEHEQRLLESGEGVSLDGGPDLIKPFSIQALDRMIIDRIQRAKIFVEMEGK